MGLGSVLPVLVGEDNGRKATALVADGVITEPSLAYTRSTAASYYDANGLVAYAAVNEPRKHHIQDGRGDFGLLVEEARTNLITRSSIASTGWTLSGSATRTGGAFNSPDGTTNATQLTLAASTSSGIFITSAIAVTTVPHTFSYFIKKVSGTGKFLFLGSSTVGAWGGAGNFIATFNTETGVITSVGSAVTSSRVVTLPNGWYRVAMTGTPIAGTTTTNLIQNAEALAGVYGIFGVQVEAGAFATTLITTTGSAVTRAASSCLIANLATQTWFDVTQGTFRADFKRNSAVVGDSYVVSLDDGTSSNVVACGQSSSSRQLLGSVVSAGASQFLGELSTADANIRNRVALTYQQNNTQFAGNGQITANDTACTLGADMVTLRVGYGVASGKVLNGVIRNLSYDAERIGSEVLFLGGLDENRSTLLIDVAGSPKLYLTYIKDNLGALRSYLREVPEGTNKGIFVCSHGGGGSGETIRTSLNFSSAITSNYMMLYPYGRYNPLLQLTTFNAGGILFDVAGASDDSDFINRMVTDAVTIENGAVSGKIDPTNFNMLGISNGAMMNYRYGSNAYRLNYTYKPTKIVALCGIVVHDVVAEPFYYNKPLLTVNSEEDLVVPVGGTQYYRSWADSKAIYEDVVDDYSFFIETETGAHGLAGVVSGLAAHTPPYVLEPLIISFFNGTL